MSKFKKITILASLCFTMNNAKAGCALPDEGFEGGCLSVEENYKVPNGQKINLFYQIFGKNDPLKKTIIFINGGPGNGNNAHSGALAYQNLADQFNVLFYDQRGIGHSDRLTAENIQNKDVINYSTDANVDDLAQLIDQVAGGKAFIFGHSYGGMLAYAFAVKYPEKLYGMLNLAGSTNALDRIYTYHENDSYNEKLYAFLGVEKVQALIKLITEKKALDHQGRELTFDFLGQVMQFYKGSYRGQVEVIPNFFKKLLEINKDLIAATQIVVPESPRSLSRKMSKYTKELMGEESPEIFNEFFHKIIYCREFFNPLVASQIDSSASQKIIDFYMSSCGEYRDPRLHSVFDVRPQLKNMKAPVLIISASHDLNVSSYAQQADYLFLANIKNNIHFVTLNKSAHIAFEDAPNCLEKSIRDFANDAENITANKIWSCDESNFQP